MQFFTSWRAVRSVGLANKLAIESNGKFQVDVSRGHADAVRIEEAQRQRAAEALLQASSQIAASQPRMTTTNCMWMGNMLNCTSMQWAWESRLNAVRQTVDRATTDLTCAMTCRTVN
jgi:hypothetical protein